MSTNFTFYDGRVPWRQHFWQFWVPKYNRDLWRCQHCGEIFRPLVGSESTFHEHLGPESSSGMTYLEFCKRHNLPDYSDMTTAEYLKKYRR